MCFSSVCFHMSVCLSCLCVCLLCVCLSEGPKGEVRAKVARILKSYRLGSSTIVCVCVCGGGGGGGGGGG